MFKRIKTLYKRWKISRSGDVEGSVTKLLSDTCSAYLARGIVYDSAIGYTIKMSTTSGNVDHFVTIITRVRTNLVRDDFQSNLALIDLVSTNVEDWLRTNEGYRVSLDEAVHVIGKEVQLLTEAILGFSERNNVLESAVTRKLAPLYDELEVVRLAISEYITGSTVNG